MVTGRLYLKCGLRRTFAHTHKVELSPLLFFGLAHFRTDKLSASNDAIFGRIRMWGCSTCDIWHVKRGKRAEFKRVEGDGMEHNIRRFLTNIYCPIDPFRCTRKFNAIKWGSISTFFSFYQASLLSIRRVKCIYSRVGHLIICCDFFVKLLRI
jgi:hypothetical protein